MFNNIKKIIATVLLVTVLIPVLPVNAITESVTKEEVIEESSGSKDNTVNEETKDNNELEEEAEIEVDKGTTTEDIQNKEDIMVPDVEIETPKDIEINENLGKIYSKINIDDLQQEKSAYSNNAIMERPEVIEKLQVMKDYTVLEKKTDSDFEVALAYSDGTYRYVGESNTYNEAMKLVDEVQVAIDNKVEVPKEFNNVSAVRTDENIIPTIINSNGQVVYSTNSMGRFYKHIGGKPYPYADKNTNVYNDSSLTKAFTYVNQGYVDDAPILYDNGTAAKVLVAGYEGWVNRNTKSSEYDLLIIPINQVKNPSYYYVEGGDLKHYITMDLTGTRGSSITIGKAPSFMKAGVKYLSYDGIYFYDGTNIQNGLNTLINDYKNNTRSKAVNGSNPFYLYFKNLPFRSMSLYSASDLNRFINNNTQANSKLRNSGQALKDAELKYGVNSVMALGIAINESGWGMSSIAQSKNNIFGLNAIDSNPGQAADTYSSVAACISEFAKNYISRGYADPSDWRYYGGHVGDKKNGANVKYASDPFWGEKASQYAYQIDKYLGGKDNDNHQLAMATTANNVYSNNGTLLYRVLASMGDYGAYVNTPFIITSNDTYQISGRQSYQIYAERNTPIYSGGDSNKYHGNYNWNDKGYISNNGVKLLNLGKDLDSQKVALEIKSGATRFDTAVNLSKENYSKSDNVILVNGSAIADGLTASPLASVYNAPILLTESTGVPVVTQNEIKRLGAKNVIIVGGTGVVNSQVEKILNSIGVTKIIRLGGEERYKTSLEIAKHIDNNFYDVNNIIMANGYGEADAMSIAPVAVRDKMPIILTDGRDIEESMFQWLKVESLSTAYVVGGTSAVNQNVVNKLNTITKENILNNRIGGKDRFETNALVIKKWFGNTNYEKIYATKSYVLVDALTASPIAGKDKAPIVLVPGDKKNNLDLHQSQKDVLSPKSSKKVIQVGGDVSPLGINTLIKILK